MKTVFRAFALSCTLLLPLASCSNGQSSASQEDHSAPPASSSTASNSDSQADEQDAALEQEVTALLSAFPAENVRVEQTDTRLAVSAFDPEASAAVTAAQEIGGSAPAGWADYEAAWAADAQSLAQNYPDGYTTLSVESDEAGTTIYVTYVNGKQTYSIFGSNAVSQDNPPTISLEEFEQIQTGMSYQEVFDLVGSRGELLSEADLGLGDEYYTAIYSWDGEGALGANASVTFQGGYVTSKAQAGLE
mgnify:CR=1 FL=1